MPLLGTPTFGSRIDQQQVPSLLRGLADPVVRRLVVESPDGRTFPIVDYRLSAPSCDARGNVVGPSRHLTLMPRGCQR